MADLTPERIAARRKRLRVEHATRRLFHTTECACGESLPCPVLADELGWLDEVERLRAELAKRPKSRLGEQVNRLSNMVGDLERERDDLRSVLGEVLTLRQTADTHDPAWRDLDRRIEHAVRVDEQDGGCTDG